MLVVGSDTLIEEDEREVTFQAVELARARGWLVLCDPNLRPRRWNSEQSMLAVVHRLVDGANVVKCNGNEAMALSGVADPLAAARELSHEGATVAVTMGSQGAVLCAEGELISKTPAPAVEVVDATGAGDSVAGVLAAAIARGLELRELAPALELALGVAAGVIERWGATDGLPDADSARELLATAL